MKIKSEHYSKLASLYFDSASKCTQSELLDFWRTSESNCVKCPIIYFMAGLRDQIISTYIYEHLNYLNDIHLQTARKLIFKDYIANLLKD